MTRPFAPRGLLGAVLALTACAQAEPVLGPTHPSDAADMATSESGPIGPFVEDLGATSSSADLAHVPTGVAPTGTWQPMPSPTDGLAISLDSKSPDVTIAGGAPAIVWVEGLDTRVARLVGGSWQLLGGPINPRPSAATQAPKIAARGSALQIAFMQLASPSASTYSFYIHRWSGMTWEPMGSPVDLQLTFLPGVSLALTSTAMPVVTWVRQVSGTSSGPSNVYVQRFDGSAFQPYGPNFAAEGASSSALASQVRIDAADHVYLAWQESFVHVYQDDGTWSAVGDASGKLASSAATTSSYEQELALDGKSRPVVAWMEYENGAAGIHVSRFDAGQWQPLVTSPVGANPGATGAQLGSLAIDGLDTPFVAWVEPDAANVEQIYVGRIAGGGFTLVGQPLAAPSGFDWLSTPMLVIDDADVPYLVYTARQISDGKYRLLVYRYG